jgi:thiopurine S-methyltransferase
MDAEFWHQCWEENDIGFHEESANPLLVKYISQLNLREGNRVFLPLCGKTSSIPWLRSKGYQVAGIELSQIAIDQLFEAMNIEPSITKVGSLLHYSSDGIDMFVGDFFDLSSAELGQIDAIFDRGSLVALPYEIRITYAKHLTAVTNNAPQLLLCFEYDENEMQGPPFSITLNELKAHYIESYDLTILDSSPFNFFGDDMNVKENAWLISPR